MFVSKFASSVGTEELIWIFLCLKSFKSFTFCICTFFPLLIFVKCSFARRSMNMSRKFQRFYRCFFLSVSISAELKSFEFQADVHGSVSSTAVWCVLIFTATTLWSAPTRWIAVTSRFCCTSTAPSLTLSSMTQKGRASRSEIPWCCPPMIRWWSSPRLDPRPALWPASRGPGSFGAGACGGGPACWSSPSFHQW